MNYDQLIQSALNEVEKAESSKSLEGIRVKYFGKNGIVTRELKSISLLPVHEKRN